MNTRSALWTVLVTAVLLPAVGCTPPKATRLDTANTAYQRGDYALAYREGAAVAEGRITPPPSAAQRQEAAYVAGMSAYRIKDVNDAERYLNMAARSSDSQLAGSALATLGLIYREQNRFEQSAHVLTQAATRLVGQDRANAYFYAALAQQRLGRWTDARTSLSQAARATSNPSFQRQIADQLQVTGFTVQLGAFTDQANAQRTAQTYAAQATRLGYGAPQITPAILQGKQMYLVQVGHFPSHSSAAGAQANLNAPRALIVPVSQAKR